MYEVISAQKENGITQADVIASVKVARPNARIEDIRETDTEWEVRLVTDRVSSSKRADFPDDFPGDAKPDSDAGSEDDVVEPDEDPTDEKEEPKKDGEDKPKDEKKDDKKEKSSDPVSEIEKLIGQVQDLLGELGGKAKEVTDQANEHKDKVDEIHKLVDPEADVPVDGVPPVDDVDKVGPTPGNPPVPPRPSAPGKLDARKPPFLPGGGVSTFTKRRTEIGVHPGVDEEGNKISITAAAKELEEDESYVDYVLVSIKEDSGGKYVAKLQLKD